METLERASPHFVRCVKPNASRRKQHMEVRMVLEQLQYSGVFQVRCPLICAVVD
jgi:myosin heavy subunit